MSRIGTLLLFLIAGGWADLPTNCSYNEVAGKWILYEGTRVHGSSVNCTNFGSPVSRIRVDLRYPNVAIDEFGNEGRWTMIYNQGFDVTVNQRNYFAFLYYTENGDIITSHCGQTFPGWSHDVTLRHWACFYGRRQASVAPKQHTDPFHHVPRAQETLTREALTGIVNRVNSAQTSWRAKVYDSYIGKTHEHMLKRRGGKRSWLPNSVGPAPASSVHGHKVSRLPQAFDWRNVSGVNYVSKVRDQGACGSCYAFSSTGMLEARLRVQTNNRLQVQLSPADIVTCTELSQGCQGGFPYLIAGKYAHEYGAVNESCNPYSVFPTTCKRGCQKYYTAGYSYVGGYYGASNEELMLLELIEGGPFSVSFEVYDDFESYESGIYHRVLLDKYNPFETVNHAVLVVGYGRNETTGEKFWIVKNSWGEDWGEEGYFRIRRGTDECSIESCSVRATPIP